MTSAILGPMATMTRSAASSTPIALAAMAVLGFLGWLIKRSSEEQAQDSRRAAFLRALAANPAAIPPEMYVAYAEDPNWRGTALRALTDPDLADEVRAALRQALAAA